MTFQTSISGLRASQAHLETIGNNIANSSTTGFKQGRAEFADIFAVSQTGVSENATGNGVTISRISQQFSQGNITTTEKVLDLAIDGEGFFILEDQDSRVYSRAGEFGLDRDGFIVNAQQQRLVTNQVDASGNITNVTGPLQINTSASDPVATTNLDLSLNLDVGATTFAPVPPIDVDDTTSFNHSTSLTIFDSLGNSHPTSLYYQKTGANTWNSQVSIDGNLIPGNHTLVFDTSGALDVGASNTAALPAYTIPGSGAAPLNLAFDYTGTTQFGNGFTSNAVNQNGNAAGLFNGLSIDDEGIISANYNTGDPIVQGQIVMTRFQNPQGLLQLGGNAFAETNDSGRPGQASAPGSSGVGTLRSGALEESNVDLTEQLVALIVAQRNFQANAQAITTADTITQTVINI